MDRASARRRADACFAVAARSTTIAAEREAAIGRGKAICAAAGLDLDMFEIPGRERRRADRNTGKAARRPGKVEITIGDTIEALRAALERRAAETGAAPDETIYDARRRNFDAAAAAARLRDALRTAR